jgi:hypothetical protein
MKKNNRNVVEWLLEEDQPSIRYYTLVHLLGRRKNDPDVKEAYSDIPKKGWAKKIFSSQKPGGYWEKKDSLYRPKYLATNWQALVLSDLGLTSKDRRIKKVADLFFKQWLSIPSGENVFNDEVCIVGNTARMMTRFGYEDDERVKKLFDRLVEDQKEDGGWHCFPSKKGTLDGWEGLAAFSALPRSKWTRKIKDSVERGTEFYLEKRLFKEGQRKYYPWFKFHYPNHYYYDVLVGLDVITSLGYGKDKRLKEALELLNQKKRRDGRWDMDALHPDVGQGAKYPSMKGATPLVIERPGQPSKMITLRALRVLNRIE